VLIKSCRQKLGNLLAWFFLTVLSAKQMNCHLNMEYEDIISHQGFVKL
jgi:hypothetical protein